jgi:hypothetical protein
LPLPLPSYPATHQSANTKTDARASIDSEVAAMSPAERDAYIKDLEDAEKTGAPKKGSFLEKLIERGNKKTEEQLVKEAEERQRAAGIIR